MDNNGANNKDSEPPPQQEEAAPTLGEQEEEAKTMAEWVDELFSADEERELAAEQLLGGCLDLVCTYPEGYKFRQPLYSCKTCFAVTGKLAGICYACSNNCHEGHELVELYTKRNFCCDCGNSKFESKCKLFEEKDTLNKRNKYNDNFKGLYCVCKKPYPPDENDADATEEDMVQCCVCEDWFHPSHIFPPGQLKTPIDPEGKLPDEIEGLICKDCIGKHPFLALYPSKPVVEEEQNQQRQVTGNDECKLAALKASAVRTADGKEPESMWEWFGWRNRLCKCRKCMDLYEDLDCAFLVDPEDTIFYYEQQGRERVAAQKQKEEAENPKTGLVVAEETTKNKDAELFLVQGLEEMKDHLAQFFEQRSAGGKRAITTEDVQQCFEELQAKRQKRMEQEQDENPIDGAWTQ